MTKLLAEQRNGWIIILGSIDDEAALVKLQVKNESGDHVSLKRILMILGYAQYTEKIIPEAHPSILNNDSTIV